FGRLRPTGIDLSRPTFHRLGIAGQLAHAYLEAKIQQLSEKEYKALRDFVRSPEEKRMAARDLSNLLTHPLSEPNTYLSQLLLLIKDPDFTEPLAFLIAQDVLQPETFSAVIAESKPAWVPLLPGRQPSQSK